jgi:hypothetical protein
MQDADKIIDTVGCSEEEAARLRLLFRMGASRFKSRWRFSDTESPDLILLDPETEIGRAAREVSLQLSKPFISIVDLGAEDGPDWALRRPLKLDGIVRMVNLLCPPVAVEAAPAAPVLKVVSQGENFFDLDLEDGASSANDGLPSIQMPEIVRGFGAHDVDALFKRDPLSQTAEVLLPHHLSADTGIEHTEGPTLRTAARIDETAERLRSNEAREAPNIDPSLRRSFVKDTRSFPLIDYLTQPLLGAAERIEMSGLPWLVLDPVSQSYHSDADLPALELYCLQELPRAAFAQLTSSELAAVRARAPAKPWVRLRWLVRYLTSNGKLSSQLDPAGRFKLERPIELARDYPAAFRVSTSMLRELQPLHEIAKLAKASMTEVINVVNAYESVSMLESQLRERFR